MVGNCPFDRCSLHLRRLSATTTQRLSAALKSTNVRILSLGHSYSRIGLWKQVARRDRRAMSGGWMATVELGQLVEGARLFMHVRTIYKGAAAGTGADPSHQARPRPAAVFVVGTVVEVAVDLKRP